MTQNQIGCSALLVLVMGAPALAGPPIEVYRQANAQALRNLETVYVEYILESREGRLPPQERLRRLYADPEMLDEAWRVVKRNAEAERERVILCATVDPMEWKIATQDLRDLDQIASQERLGRAGLLMLDQSRSGLTAHHIRVDLLPGTLLLRPRDGGDRAPNKRGESSLLYSPLRFGVIVDRVFDKHPHASLSEKTLDGRRVLSVTLQSDDSARYELDADPEIGYRYRSVKIYHSTGGLRSEGIADDYRLVDGIWFPFEFEERTFDRDGDVVRDEKMVVQNARFNEPLPPHALQIRVSAGTVVHLSERNIQGQSMILEEQFIGTTEARALVADIARPRRAQK